MQEILHLFHIIHRIFIYFSTVYTQGFVYAFAVGQKSLCVSKRSKNVVLVGERLISSQYA